MRGTKAENEKNIK